MDLSCKGSIVTCVLGNVLDDEGMIEWREKRDGNEPRISILLTLPLDRMPYGKLKSEGPKSFAFCEQLVGESNPCFRRERAAS